MSSVMQNGPNVSWLDDELRKQKAVSQELRETIGKQQVALVDQSQRIQTLEAEIARLAGQLQRIPDIEQALEHTRDDVVLRLSELRQEQQKNHTEFLRNRQAEREIDTRAVQELRIELQRLTVLEQGLSVEQAETGRLNEIVARRQQVLDEIATKLSSADDHRRQLASSIERNAVAAAKNGAAIADEVTAHQATLARVLVGETTLSRVEQQLAELQNMRAEVTRQQDELMEAQRRSDQTRAQTLTEWGRKLESHAHQMEVWADQLRFYGDQHEKNRRVLREVQELAQEVSQQQDRLRQLQRLAEEQIRRELREWQSESDQRWVQAQEQRETDLEAAGKMADQHGGRLSELEDHAQGTDSGLDAIRAEIATLRQSFESRALQADDTQQRAWSSLAKALAQVSTELSGGEQDA